MRSLSGAELLEVWEAARDERPAERALVLLAEACPEFTPEALAALSIGGRDALLLELRETIFGPDLRGYADCPHCGFQLEFAVGAADIRVEQSAAPVAEGQLSAGDFSARFRLPNSRDLAAAAATRNPDDARRELVRRCLTEPMRAGERIEHDSLPRDATERAAALMLARDPQAEVILRLTCPTCAFAWAATLDIGEFLWAELSAQASRLLHEVDTLARAYGWRETDVLTLSARRREAYLAMAGA